MPLSVKSFSAGFMIAALSFGLARASLAETKTLPALGVTRVLFSTPGELVIQPGNDERLMVEAEPKVLAQLDISVSGGEMSLRSKGGGFSTDKPLKFTLTVKAFSGLKSSAAGNSVVSGFSSGDVSIECAGSGSVSLKNMNVQRLVLTIPGSGNIDAAGRGDSLKAAIRGAGTIDAASFMSQTAVALIDGSGTIRVAVQESLNATINGSGDIEYKGNAKVTKSINGAGNVQQM